MQGQGVGKLILRAGCGWDAPGEARDGESSGRQERGVAFHPHGLLLAFQELELPFPFRPDVSLQGSLPRIYNPPSPGWSHCWVFPCTWELRLH